MPDYFAEQLSEYSLDTPQEPIAIIVWLLWFAALIYLSIRYRNRYLEINRKNLIWLAVLSLSVLILTPFFNVPLSSSGAGVDSQRLILFAAVPWLVAGGIVGMIPAVLLAGMSGLLAAYFFTHQIFTPLIFMTAAIIFTLSARQRYRPFFFRLLRFPLLAALFSALVSVPFLFISCFFRSTGEFPSRMVDVINEFPGTALSFGGMILIGGVICVFIKMAVGKAWGTQQPLKPGPGENGLRFRLIIMISLVLLALSVVLLISNWVNAENNARRTAVKRLTTTANVASENLSVFIETGESLISRFAEDDRLLAEDPETISNLLSQQVDLLPYFDQLAVISLNGEIIASYPHEAAIPLPLDLNVNDLFQSSSDRIAFFSSSDPIANEGGGFTVNLLVRVSNSSTAVSRILWGRTEFIKNTYVAPVMETFNALEAYGGEGQIVDRDGATLFRTGLQGEGGAYTGVSYPTATFFEGESVDGEVVLQYYQPVENTDLSVLTSLPMQTVQRAAWQSVSPLLLFCMGGIFLVFLVLLFVLSPVEKSLKQLETAANDIAAGKINSALLTNRSAQATPALREAFQRMMLSYEKLAREHPDLLTLSERIAHQLTLQESLQLILIAALDRGVSSARILIKDGAVTTRSSSPHYRIGLGRQTRLLSALDEDILALTHSKGMLVLQNYQLGKFVTIQKGMPYPASMIAVPLEWKDSSLGVLWVTYDDRRHLKEEEIPFFRDLSKKASFAIINAKSVGKSLEITNQLESVLDILKDPIMISDSLGRIVFLNEAAQLLINTQEGEYIGRMVSSMFHDENLLSLLQEAEHETQSMEIQLSDGKIYDVVASPTQMEDRQNGIVVLFKDVTHYKVQDVRKTEFVTTASHELRSPLTLIHGYAKILRLTGNLNEQQDAYVLNIVERVEEMRNLIQNLLDLGRLEGGDSLEVKNIAAGEIVNQVVEGLMAQSNQKNINLTVSLPSPPIKIEADVALLRLAVRNLVDNAIKFTKMGGDVSVTVSAQNDDVIIKVEDTGIGIAPLDRRHIFEKFYRVSLQDEEEYQGSGLGLAIVKSIAERHHGEVWVDSKLGKGSTFFLRIPMKQ